MKTFILRARKVSTRWERIKSSIGAKEHPEVIAHTIVNAFFISNGFREDVEIYIILDSSEDFPRTIKLDGSKGLSITGFHEDAILSLIEQALKAGMDLQKNETRMVTPALQISGFGFEKLVGSLLETRSVYLLDRKGDDIRTIELSDDPVFILTDHLPMPKNSINSFKRRGLKLISLGKKMLFASQCVILIHHELDRMQ